MNDLLAEGSKRFWDDANEHAEEGEDLPDCTAASHLAAASGELRNVTETTRHAVTGRSNNEHLFYRSYAEIKRRIEIAREARPVLTVDDLLARHAEEERKNELREKLAAAEGEGKLVDITHETRQAVTGRAFPESMMYRTTDEARMRINAARARSGRPGADGTSSPHGSGSEHSAGGDDDDGESADCPACEAGAPAGAGDAAPADAAPAAPEQLSAPREYARDEGGRQSNSKDTSAQHAAAADQAPRDEGGQEEEDLT
jgi:hypothetical protein